MSYIHKIATLVHPNLCLLQYTVREPYFAKFVKCHTRLFDLISNVQIQAFIPGYSAAKIAKMLHILNNVINNSKWSCNL